MAPKVTKAARRTVIRKAKGRCSICGQRLRSKEEVTLDHIQPVSMGGKNSIDNLRAAHKECNMARGTLDL